MDNRWTSEQVFQVSCSFPREKRGFVSRKPSRLEKATILCCVHGRTLERVLRTWQSRLVVMHNANELQPFWHF